MDFVDIAFVVPLKEEFDRLKEVFHVTNDHVEGTQFWVELAIPSTSYKAIAVLQDAMGKSAASRATEMLLSKFDIGVLMLVGIAGGLSNDVAVGDICFSGSIFDILENSKVSDGAAGKVKIEYNTIPFKTDSFLSFAFKYVSLGESLKSAYDEWQSQQYYSAAKMVPNEFVGRNGKNEFIGIPQIHEGSIVCGSVSKSDLYKSNVSTLDRKLLAIETEAGGVFSSAERRNVPAIAIRGICDYSDKNKNKLEEQTGGRTRAIAMNNVATFVKLQLENPQFHRFLDQRRDAFNGTQKHAADEKALTEIVPSALESLRTEIHGQLSQLSPEYQGKAIGYRLPLPRVKYAASNATVSPKLKNFDPVNFLEAVTKHQIIFLSTPKSYPDGGLPWMMAAELSLIEIDAKQVMPVVIDGNNIRAPSGTLRKHSAVDIDKINALGNSTLAFIIYDFDPGSRTRVEFLRAQMELYTGAKFIILSKKGAMLSDNSPLLISASAEKYELCEISFSELSAFFKRAFNFEDQQAGVLTLRLQSMFRKFDLNAHPSYFAALGNDVLTSLLKANRRSELLQLAVGGFLSFVVAGDKDDIVLSRTTRETFLRKFAYHCEFLKERFDEAALVRFVSDFAVEKDFEIDSILFIRSFQEKGIVHFEDGYAKISLPFIASYLLAVELAGRPGDAVNYFNFDLDDDFDYPTFDIYCELNVSPAIADRLKLRMREGLERERGLRPDSHILLSNEIRPASIDNPARLKGLQDQLEKAVSDVVSNRANSGEKQQILDVAEKIEAEARHYNASEASKEIASEPKAETSNSSDFRQLYHIWSISIALLGAGSEKLDRAPKRELCQLIVETGALLIDRMLRTFPKAGFDKLKEEMKTDESIRSLFSLDEKVAISEKQRTLVQAVVEAYEFSLLGYPMRIVLEQLGNLASQPVLRSSISSVSSDGLIENLIARVWAAEIDAGKEKSNLLEAVAKLPPAPFLRVSLSTYFIVRVFWNHWLPENRLALLDAAETAMKPLNRSIEKGQLKRLIEKAGSEGG